MDKSKIKYVAVIQCDKTRKRCSGFACSRSFFDRTFAFEGYPDDTRYITMTCGGCDGSKTGISLGHFGELLERRTDMKKDEVAVHLSSCIVTHNRHHDRCPFGQNIRREIEALGFEHIVEGSYQSQLARKRRANGEYNTYDSVDFE